MYCTVVFSSHFRMFSLSRSLMAGGHLVQNILVLQLIITRDTSLTSASIKNSRKHITKGNYDMVSAAASYLCAED